jgi:hypothetical protein
MNQRKNRFKPTFANQLTKIAKKGHPAPKKALFNRKNGCKKITEDFFSKEMV